MSAVTAATQAPTRYVEHVMGMPISLALRGRHTADATARTAWDRALAELRAADRLFSTYRSDSVISRINAGELRVEDGPPELAEVLALARRAEVESAGAFSVWLPAEPADPGSPRRLDPSGVVKGWAADRAARFLEELPGTDYCLSAGGDVVGRVRTGGEPWRIGVENPHDPSRLVAVVPLRHGAVATSGTAHRGAHLLDARTGAVPRGLSAVTVIGPSLTWADIDATAAYALGSGAADWLATRPISSALVVFPDGSTQLVQPTPAPGQSVSGVEQTPDHDRDHT